MNSGLHPAEAWLDHHGKALRARFNPISYSRLMAAMDSHDVGRGRGGWRTALARTRTPVQIIAITSDLLYPPRDQQQLADTSAGRAPRLAGRPTGPRCLPDRTGSGRVPGGGFSPASRRVGATVTEGLPMTAAASSAHGG
jgi:hypothetical protein